jgi:hypothetical protein
MRQTKVLLVVAVLSTLAVAAVAQEESPGLVSKIYLVIVEPGDTLRFEAAFREHMQLHEKNNDSWSWHTWQIVNGEHFGQFLIRSHGHSWKDFDEHAEARRLDLADFMAHVAPHIKEISSTLEVFEPSISNWSDEDSRPQLVEMIRFSLHYAATEDFLGVIEKVHRAVREKDPSADYAWSTTVNGSDGPTMTLAVPRSGWADYAAGGDAASLWQMVEEVHGADEARALRETLGRSIRSQKSSVIQFRADLSYQAGG